MQLTERDKRILQAVHTYDGMLGFKQIQRIFGMGKSQAEQRLKLLYQHQYLNRPIRKQRMRLPQMIYWLDKQGAELVASLEGLSTAQLGWRKEPRWFQVEHDLAVNDFRLDISEACKKNLDISLETWIPEGEFWSYPDLVEYRYSDRKLQRRIRPDGYFMLTIPRNRIRYLLEIDRGTEDNPRFLREKILPGMAYIRTKKYEERFGHRSGRWLVVTTGERRMQNMLRQARRVDNKGIFYFTTYDQISVESILQSPIWLRPDRDGPVPLVFID
jgi:hypothetical protein